MELKTWLNQPALWLIKNHWLALVVMLGLQYVSGEAIGGGGVGVGLMSYADWLVIHRVNSKLILIVAVLLVLVKGYLWLVRSGKISRLNSLV